MARSTDTREDRPESYERERGQIQFQILWPRGFLELGCRPHIFLGLGQFGTFLTVVSDNRMLFGWSWRIVLKMEQGSQIWLQ